MSTSCIPVDIRVTETGSISPRRGKSGRDADLFTEDLDADETSRSSIVFHEAHSGQRPAQRNSSAPHSEQTKDLVLRAARTHLTFAEYFLQNP
jgi:hypothetical protein